MHVLQTGHVTVSGWLLFNLNSTLCSITAYLSREINLSLNLLS